MTHVKIGFSATLVCLAVLQACLLGTAAISGVILNHALSMTASPSPKCVCPVRVTPKREFEPSVGSASVAVDARARDEIKQGLEADGWTFAGDASKEQCPPGVRCPNIQPSYIRPVQPNYVRPSYVQPSYVQPSYVQPYVQPTQPTYVQPYVQPVQPYVQPVQPSVAQPSRIQPGDKPAQVSSRYQIALFLIPGDPVSEKLKSWFTNDATLVEWRSKCSFQEYTPKNDLYLTLKSRSGRMLKDEVPTSQFPAIVVATPDGGHIHAAGQSTLPATAAELASDIRKGAEYQRQVPLKGVVPDSPVSAGNDWDSQGSGDCVGPNCPVRPDSYPDSYPDSWVPGERLFPGLLSKVKNPATGFAKDALWGWLDIIVTGAVVVCVVAGGLFALVFLCFVCLVAVWIVRRKK